MNHRKVDATEANTTLTPTPTMVVTMRYGFNRLPNLSEPCSRGFDAGYMAGAGTAEFIGANVHKIALRKDYTHDVQAMLRAAPDAGVMDVCNRKNPTGTLTSRGDIKSVLANKPKGSILLPDEAYMLRRTRT